MQFSAPLPHPELKWNFTVKLSKTESFWPPPHQQWSEKYLLCSNFLSSDCAFFKDAFNILLLKPIKILCYLRIFEQIINTMQMDKFLRGLYTSFKSVYFWFDLYETSYAYVKINS